MRTETVTVSENFFWIRQQEIKELRLTCSVKALYMLKNIIYGLINVVADYIVCRRMCGIPLSPQAQRGLSITFCDCSNTDQADETLCTNFVIMYGTIFTH